MITGRRGTSETRMKIGRGLRFGRTGEATFGRDSQKQSVIILGELD